MNLAQSVIIITGGASGLGAATARRLASAGAKLVLADLNEDLGQALASELNAQFVRCNVTSPDDAQAAIDSAINTYGGLTGLINCAGIGTPAKAVGRDGPLAMEAFTKIIDVNLNGSFNMIRLAAHAMMQAEPNDKGERGVIINTASVAAYDGQIGQPAYAASKAGLVGMTLPLAREFSRSGIRVMTIAPGLFKTPLLESLPEEAQKSLGMQVPFPSRLGEPDEYAQLAQQIFENTMLNGETIRLDGAIRMAPK
ncbi:short-chain dehydrogenase/reductase SDR [Oceanococcus atlanticus]|uniref:Short-chain dehydrogenase/reductase SDR n=1 Tax=Oceanococcus atlanticus TaxID=1317117 RepID=A0A1Y1SAE6_9GAMM|nr:3-hydroxyacyl-CoA dehydrogenase [Oceanococcus atlanticus]ORE85388.1 short-chain dehydrogenase/reductase SDR [Oceanococcus atlanticus]